MSWSFNDSTYLSKTPRVPRNTCACWMLSPSPSSQALPRPWNPPPLLLLSLLLLSVWWLLYCHFPFLSHLYPPLGGHFHCKHPLLISQGLPHPCLCLLPAARMPWDESRMAVYKAGGRNRTEEALSTKQGALYSGSRWREAEWEMILFQLGFN